MGCRGCAPCWVQGKARILRPYRLRRGLYGRKITGFFLLIRVISQPIIF